MNSLSTVGPNEILLKYYGKRELLRKISNMEAEYDVPMHFNPALLPESSAAVGPDIQHGLWDYGMEVAGAPKKYHKKQTPTLEAGMYGFTGGEELFAVKGYLYAHSAYQLVVVRCHFVAMVLKERQCNWPLAGHVAVILLFMTSHVV